MIKVKSALITALFLFMLVSGVAAATSNYYIDSNNDMWVSENLTASSTTTIYLEKTAGYSPDGSAVFFSYFDGDSTGWTETDPNSDLTFQNDRLEFSSVRRDVDAYVYQQNTDIAEEDTIIDFEFQVTGGSNPGIISMGMIGSNVDDSLSVNYGYAYQAMYSNSNPRAYIMDSGTKYQDTVTGSLSTSTTYYARTIRNGNTVTTKLYSDADRTSQVLSTSSVTQSFTDTGLQYVYLLNGFDLPSDQDDTISGWIDNFNVRKYIATEPTVTITDMTTYYKVEIENNIASDVDNYQIKIDGSNLGITAQTESWDVNFSPISSVSVNLTSPTNNSYVNDNNFTFSINGTGPLNATIFIDSVDSWNGSVSVGNNTKQISITEGEHSWYVNASADDTVFNNSEQWNFTYDITAPTAAETILNPSGDVIENNTFYVSTRWTDIALKNGSFYWNNGSGWNLDVAAGLSGTSDWQNNSFNTTGYLGDTIQWKQESYDQAGNLQNVTGSFEVVNSALDIYVYDESNQTQILPSDVTVYDANASYAATISNSTKIASVDYNSLNESGKYIVSVDAEGYYSRKGIVYVDRVGLSQLDIYLPSESKSVIYDVFEIEDNTATYDYSDLILRLDKPLPNGTDTVYQSYLDFDGKAATYLIADDSYLLYIITPDSTLNFGWLNPDPDGTIEIVLQEVELQDYYDDWLQVEVTFNNDTRLINLEYESDTSISSANFSILKDGVEVYNATAATITGSFNYNAVDDGSYIVQFDIVRTDGETFSNAWTYRYGTVDVDFLPENTPQWLSNLIVAAAALMSLLAFGSYRADMAAILSVGIIGLGSVFGWIDIPAVALSLLILVAASAVINFQRKEERT